MRFDSRTNVHVGERTIISLSPKTLVDVDTGEAFDLSSDDYASVSSTTDGWIAYNGSEYTIPSVYSPSEGGEVMMALLDSPFSPESARIVGAWTLADQRDINFPGSIEYGEKHLLPRRPLTRHRVGLPECAGHGVRAGEGMTAREDRSRPGWPGPQADSPRARPRRTYWRMPPLRK